MSLALTGLLLGINVFLLGAHFFFRRKRLYGEPPLLNHVIPYFGRALEFGRDPIKFLKKLQQKYGNVATFKMAGWNVHAIVHPLDVANIEKNKKLRMDFIAGEFARRLVGNEHSFYNSEMTTYDVTHPIYQRNKELPRSFYQNMRGASQMENLHKSCVKNTVDIIRLVKDNKLELQDKNNKVDLYKLADTLILFLTCRNLLGSIQDKEEYFKETKNLYERLTKFVKHTIFLLHGVPSKLLPNAKKSRKEALELLKGFDIPNRKDVSDAVMSIFNAHPTEKYFLNHTLLALWAGHTNTGPALFWILFYLLKYPHVLREVEKEIETLLLSKQKENNYETTTSKRKASLDDILKLEKSDLDELIILESVLLEVLRMVASSMSMRSASEDMTFESHDNKRFKIRKGDMVFYYSQMLHLDSGVYKEPEKFIYDRYVERKASDQSSSDSGSDTETLRKRTRFSKNGTRIAPSRSHLAFGFGEGRCPGQKMAIMELKLMVAAILTAFEPSLEPYKEEPKLNLAHVGFGVLPPKIKSPIMINLEKKEK